MTCSFGKASWNSWICKYGWFKYWYYWVVFLIDLLRFCSKNALPFSMSSMFSVLGKLLCQTKLLAIQLFSRSPCPPCSLFLVSYSEMERLIIQLFPHSPCRSMFSVLCKLLRDGARLSGQCNRLIVLPFSTVLELLTEWAIIRAILFFNCSILDVFYQFSVPGS